MRKGQQSKNLEDKRARTTGTKKADRLRMDKRPLGGNPFQEAAHEAASRTMDRGHKNPFNAAMEKAKKSDTVKLRYREFNDPTANWERERRGRPNKIDAKRRKSLKYIQD